jgi:hypothetical protein
MKIFLVMWLYVSQWVVNHERRQQVDVGQKVSISILKVLQKQTKMKKLNLFALKFISQLVIIDQ